MTERPFLIISSEVYTVSVHLTHGKRIINVLPTAGIWISKQRFCQMHEMYDG